MAQTLREGRPAITCRKSDEMYLDELRWAEIERWEAQHALRTPAERVEIALEMAEDLVTTRRLSIAEQRSILTLVQLVRGQP